MTKALSALALLMLAACSSFDTPDTSATLAAERAALIAEATAIRQTLVAQRTAVMATSVAVETEVVRRNSINQQLLATLMVGNPPTQQVVSINPVGTYYLPLGLELPEARAIVTPGANETPGPGGQFVDTVTARSLRPSDGCAQSAVSAFTLQDDKIYVVTRATTISAGTQVSVEWRLDGEVIDRAAYSVPRAEDDFCIWFYLDSFSPGNWTVQLAADGVPIEPAPSFQVTE